MYVLYAIIYLVRRIDSGLHYSLYNLSCPVCTEKPSPLLAKLRLPFAWLAVHDRALYQWHVLNIYDRDNLVSFIKKKFVI